MSDIRVEKLAKVLVQYSLNVQPGDLFALVTDPPASSLNLAIARQAILAGAFVDMQVHQPGFNELFYKLGSDEQLDHVSPIHKLLVEQYKHYLVVDAEQNTREFSNVDPARMKRSSQARRPLFKTMLERTAKKDLHWCYTVFPVAAYAQEADMSLSEYEDFVYGAGLLDLDDPVAAWRKIGEDQQRVCDWFKGKQQVVIKGSDIDLSLSVAGRSFENACGHENFPDGEIYTSPVEDSVNGWARFAYPAIYGGHEVNNVEVWFENGRVVKHKADKNEAYFSEVLSTDEGARFLGELGIGTNYGIQRFTKNMLFDEKIGGTIHLALGEAFPECGGKNESSVHWDLLCNMAQSEILVDGESFYRDGRMVI